MGHFPWLCWITRGYLRKPPSWKLMWNIWQWFPLEHLQKNDCIQRLHLFVGSKSFDNGFPWKKMQHIARIMVFQVIWQWFLLEKWAFLGFQVGFQACSHEIDHDFPGRSWALPMDLRGGWRPRQWTRHMARWSGKLVVCCGSIIVSSGKLTVCY